MVEYLEVFGKKYPVRIGYYVMKKVKEETGVSFQDALTQAEEDGDVEIHEVILWYALRMGAYAEHKDMDQVDLEREEIPMILDACFYEYLELFASDKFFPAKMKEMAEKDLRQKNSKAEGKTAKTPQRKT